MAKRNYRGPSGKQLWENATFQKGLMHTDETLRQGYVRTICNWDITRSGGSLETRRPFFSVLFQKPEEDSPDALKKNTFTIRPQQDQENVYYINIGNAETFESEKVEISIDDIEVIDGDTIRDTSKDQRYRLLGIDTPENGEPYYKEASHVLVDCLRRVSDDHKKPVLYIDKGSTSHKDTYGRYVAFLYLDIGAENGDREDSDFGFFDHYDGYLSSDIDDMVDGETHLNMSSLLLALGYAKLMNEDEYDEPYYIPEYDYYGSGFDGLKERRKSAQEDKLGMWGDDTFKPSDNTLEGPDFKEEKTEEETECEWEKDGDSYTSSSDETTNNPTCAEGETKTVCFMTDEDPDNPYSCQDYEAVISTTETVVEESYYEYSTPQSGLVLPVPHRFRQELSTKENDSIVFYFDNSVSDLDGSVSSLAFYDGPSSSRRGTIDSGNIVYHDDRIEVLYSDVLNDVDDDVEDFDWDSQDLYVKVRFDGSLDLDDTSLYYRFDHEDSPEQIDFDDGDRVMTEPNISVYKHNFDYQLKQTDDDYISTPFIELENETVSLNFNRIFSDLGLRYEEPIRIELVKQFRNRDHQGLYDYHTEQYGLSHIPAIDGFAFIGRVVDPRDDETLYEGLMSIRYYVSIEDGEPDFDAYSLMVETYHKDNLYQISFLSLGSGQSLNLLDSSPLEPPKYIGEESVDNGYYNLTAFALFVENDDGDIIESLVPYSDYKVRAYFAIPPTRDDKYDGYAVRWRVSSDDEDDGWKKLDWLPLVDGDGEYIEFDTDEEEYDSVDDLPDGVVSVYNDTRRDDEEKLEKAFSDGDKVFIENPDTGVLSKSTNDNLFNHIYSQEQAVVSVSRFEYTYEYVTSRLRTGSNDQDNMYYYFRKVVDEDSLDLSPSSVSVELDYSQNDERKFVGGRHRMEPHTCRKISYFNGYTLLYDSPKHPETVFVSDNQNLDYFPYKFALDQFEEPVVHIHPHKGSFLVFTNTNIFMVVEEMLESEDSEIPPEPVFRSKLVVSNMSIKRRHAHLVKSVGRNVLLYTDNSFYLLSPNRYVEDPSNMYLQRISAPIQSIFDNPTQFITRRLQYYGVAGNIFSRDWKPEIEHFVIVKNHEIWIYTSAYLEPVGESFMFISVFNLDSKLWRIYDTMAMAFPYYAQIFDSDQGYQVLLKNHPDIDKGVSLMLNEGFDIYDFQETDVDAGGVFDIKPLKLDNGSFVYNSSTEFKDVKQPVNLFYDSGYLDISPQLNKRFHKTTLEFTNINAPTIDLAVEFNLDGRIRQTSNSVRMEHITDSSSDDYGVIKEKYEFEPFVKSSNEAVDGSITFNEWQLGIQKFGPLNKLRITVPISGRGKIPGFEFGIRTHGQIKLFRHQVVFKEQRYR